MVMTGHDGRIVMVNSQTEKLFGYRRQDLVGRTVETLIPERHRKRHVGYRTGYAAKPQTRAMGAGRDLFGRRKDGSEVPIEIGLNPVETPQGRFVLASIIDITERKALEKRVAQSEALAAIGGMAAAVAHEIRNPLGSIVMGAKALSRGGLTQEDLDEVKTVLVNESQRLNRTLDDFLQFARPREPKLRPGDLNATAHEVLSAVCADEALVGRAGVAEERDPSLPPVRFDPDLIRQVLWNIIRNGLQALQGKGRLFVRTGKRAGQVFVQVEDSGPGIPRDQLEKVFMPFYTTKAKGTGLGLSISRNIVAAHGGDILIESRPGKGSRVSIVLPV